MDLENNGPSESQAATSQLGGTMPEGISAAALAKVPLALVLTNPHIEDNPIVYVNEAFGRITGYAPAAAIGRNCRFLQGPETDPGAPRRIREALETQRDISLDIVNYRADGTKFLNRLMITPLYDGENKLQCFLGVQRDMGEGPLDALTARDGGPGSISIDTLLGEIQHRVKNHLAMIIGMIRMQARMKTSEESFHALARRIESLQLLYQEMTEAGVASTRSRNVPLGAYVSRIAATIGHLDGRRSVRINVDCDAVDVNVDRAARIGLLFSELLTNALKHAFEGRHEGLVEARLKMLSSGVIRLTVTDDGVGLKPGVEWPYSAGAADPEPIDADTVREIENQARSDEAEGTQAHANVARQMADAITRGSQGQLHLRRPGQPADPTPNALTAPASAEPRSETSGGKGLGGRIVVSLVRGLGARLDVNSDTIGTTVTVDIPREGEAGE
ncbi:PAS domain-containing protein [Antarcticirhabdus aurantiaca]|uniref:PAS domain-containing protein n=1 Tax=Antarcticirhabdus aurantiaca TaxID=2606717 RepID=A0ACD4NP89_9HYPH|nr:PAS domain-containing protein [Antarcticirhabdus aurantiaca]WAJ28531.1 PAS domain-containing protein [Jeongeuplla avenae]